MQALQNRLVAATGSANVAADAMAFLREETNRLGLDFRTTADSFGSFSASALRSNMSLQQTKDVFTAVAEAATALHLSAADTQSAFLALEQMASKGTVQMQELKLQLANAIPGAFEIMAKAMGVSVQQFNEMIAKGEVLSSEALPKLGAELHRQFGERAVVSADSAQAAFNRLGNALFDLKNRLAEGGFLDAVTQSVKGLTDILNAPQTVKGMKGFAELLGDVASAAVKTAAAVGSFYSFMKDRSDAIAELKARGRDASQANITDMINTIQLRRQVIGAPTGQSTASGASTADPNYTLGSASSPSISAAAGKAARMRDRLRGQIGDIDQENARETDPQKAAALKVEEQQKKLKEALEAKAITEAEFREKSLQAEIAYQDRLTEIRQRAADQEVNIREDTYNNIAGLLQVFAGKNKAIAIALLAFEKARAIAQAIIATHVAATTALIYDPTGATSARVTAMGYVNVAAIAATGIAELATMGSSSGGGFSSGGGGGGSSSVGGSSGQTSGGIPFTKQVNVTLVGSEMATWSKIQVREFIDLLNDAGKDGSKLEFRLA